MLLNEKAHTSKQKSQATAEVRLEALAALWARQTGRSIVISSGGHAVRSSSRG